MKNKNSWKKIVDSGFVKTCDELIKRWRISLWMCPAVCLVVGTLVSNFSWSLLFIYLHSYCPNGFDIKDHERAKTISKDLSGRRRLLILKEIFLVWMFYLCTELTNINKYIFFYIIWWPSKSILYECLSMYLRTELKNTNNTFFMMCATSGSLIVT